MPGTYTIAEYKDMMKKARVLFLLLAEFQRDIYTSEASNDVMASHTGFIDCLQEMIQRLQKAAFIYQDLSPEDRLIATSRSSTIPEDENPS